MEWYRSYQPGKSPLLIEHEAIILELFEALMLTLLPL